MIPWELFPWQLVGLGLDVMGALLLGVDALGLFGLSARAEAHRAQETWFAHWAGDEEWMRRNLEEEWLPPVVLRRRLRASGAVLLMVGFLFQGIGISLG